MARKTPENITEATNQQVLAERERRLADAQASALDLGLNLKRAVPQSAVEFLADEWDRKAFGEPGATIKRIIYGPDPLTDECPELREALDRYGLEDYAEATREAILRLGSKAVPNARMQASLSKAIKLFGKESVADAFCARIMKIPFREVEVDASDTPDLDVQGSSVLTETISRYERSGFCYRFFSQACLDRYGWRGYTPVKQVNGDLVKAGTLFLGEIKRERADARRERLAEEAASAVQDVGISQQHSQASELDRLARDGHRTNGIAPLSQGEEVRAAFTGNEEAEYAGQTRNAGVEIGRAAL